MKKTEKLLETINKYNKTNTNINLDLKNIDSIESYIEKLYIDYKSGKELDDYETNILGLAIDPFIDVDECDYSENYNLLIRSICSVNDEDFSNVYAYSSEKMRKEIELLPDRDRIFLNYRFGLVDGKCRTLDEIGAMIGVTKARVVVIGERAIRNLKNKNKTVYHIINLDKLISLGNVSDEEKKQLNNAKMTALFSKDDKDIKIAKEILKNCILSEANKITPDKISIDDLGLSKEAYNELSARGIKTLEDVFKYGKILRQGRFNSKLIKELETSTKKIGYDIHAEEEKMDRLQQERPEYKLSPEQIRIVDLGLSVRTWLCLERSGIKTLDDLLKYGRLEEIRNLGEKSLIEIKEKIKELTYNLDEEQEKTKTPDKISIDDLGLSKEAYNELSARGIKTLEDVFKYGKILRQGRFNSKLIKELETSTKKIGYDIHAEEEKMDRLQQERPEYKLSPNQISLVDLDLSIRALRCLNLNGIKTLEDLLKYGRLEKIRNLGAKTLVEIKDKIKELGYDYDAKKEDKKELNQESGTGDQEGDIKVLSTESKEKDNQDQDKLKKHF